MNNPPVSAYLVASTGGCGPTLSGLLLTWLIYGRKGMKALLGPAAPGACRVTGGSLS